LANGKLDESGAAEICKDMLSLIPTAIENALALDKHIYDAATKLVAAEHLFYIGRDIDYALATEASLKLKEISYIHSEAYAAGELKHGTISLITEGTPVVAVTTVKKVCEKTVSGIREVKSRGAFVVSVCSKELSEQYDIPCDDMIIIDDVPELLYPFPLATVLQLLAYHVSALKGLDVDKPRNLAKSVTVE
jgi:glucosamine--fructose-6-phosphate aminotransferase (isomerizing)